MNVPTFRPLAAADLDAVAALARKVWQATYPGIITQAQIDYMLGERYCPAALTAYLHDAERWFELASEGAELVGFCACEMHDGEYKLDKLYVDPARQRQDIGRSLIARAEVRGRALGHDHLILAVNKRNEKAIAAYRKHGFTVRESVRVDIGHGFVMDDYIMEKRLS